MPSGTPGPVRPARGGVPGLPHEFRRRALTYQQLDQDLALHTRFFAAAALTNTVLAELCVHRARWLWISQGTLGTLLTLGGMLEHLNLHRAGCIALHERPGAGLDASFVEMEQAFVESVLQGWARESTPRYRQLIGELDRLLRAVTEGFLPLRCSGDVLRYRRVLRSVRLASGRAPSFAVCADRVCIGKALIADARQVL